MKRWEEAGVLIELLDRHARLLTETDSADWTIFWRLTPFLHFLGTEPILSLILSEYESEVERVGEAHQRHMHGLAQAATSLYATYAPALAALPSGGVEAGVLPLEDLLAKARSGPDGQVQHEPLEKMLEGMAQCLAVTMDSALVEAKRQADHLRNTLKGLLLRFDRFKKVHPGVAYVRLQMREANLNYVSSGDPVLDEAHNKQVARTYGFIRETETFAPQEGDYAQPAIVEIQREVTNIHLGLVTALGRGMSRWATVRRFAARCETFERDHLVAEIEAGGKKPEAILTLAFARYLFDSGFNPLVDAAACGLRPDVLDATNEPAIYVEAKQYENVGDGLVDALRRALAQTINTWSRLAKRWRIPEAFLLIFRRSGRPIEIENPQVHWVAKRLYVLVVDLGAASESGSRASQPVRIDIAELLRKSEEPT
jgi:hypothetical protein